MKELLRDIRKAMYGELDRANRKRGFFKSEGDGGFVIMEEVTEAGAEAERVRLEFTNLAEHIFKDEHKMASETAKKLRNAALFAAAEYTQVAAMAEKFNMKPDKLELSDEYMKYLEDNCPEAHEDKALLKFSPELKARWEMIINRMEKEDKDAEHE